jgi:glycosyltransferase involved in cell wall biosynthesis
MGQLTLNAATRVLAISRFTASEVERWAPRARLEVVPLGFEPGPSPAKERLERVVSVGAISWDYMLRKGLEDFARAARVLPDIEFVLAGRHVEPDAVDHLRSIGGPNLNLPGFLAQDAMNDLLTTSSIYLQLSRHEGFGCSVAEAMLAGCTPVLAAAGALPEVAGNAAYYVESRDPEVVAEIIGRALADPKIEEARERITMQYPAKARRRTLTEIVQETQSQRLSTRGVPVR